MTTSTNANSQNDSDKDTLRSKLLKLNLGYDVLVDQFIKTLIEFPGAFVRVPMPLHKGQTIEQWNDEKAEICRRTCEILAMMDINHTQSATDYQIMIIEPPP